MLMASTSINIDKPFVHYQQAGARALVRSLSYSNDEGWMVPLCPSSGSPPHNKGIKGRFFVTFAFDDDSFHCELFFCGRGCNRDALQTCVPVPQFGNAPVVIKLSSSQSFR